MQDIQSNLSEILISSRQVTHQKLGDVYEFVMDETLQVLECIKIESLLKGIAKPIKNAKESLEGLLFELKHVRVNPKKDNSIIINRLTQAFNEIGVEVSNPPSQSSMAICYKPLGEISDNVRFYLNPKGTMIFLSPAMKPKLITLKR